jgi:hypothetical protein
VEIGEINRTGLADNGTGQHSGGGSKKQCQPEFHCAHYRPFGGKNNRQGGTSQVAGSSGKKGVKAVEQGTGMSRFMGQACATPFQ